MWLSRNSWNSQLPIKTISNEFHENPSDGLVAEAVPHKRGQQTRYLLQRSVSEEWNEEWPVVRTVERLVQQGGWNCCCWHAFSVQASHQRHDVRICCNSSQFFYLQYETVKKMNIEINFGTPEVLIGFGGQSGIWDRSMCQWWRR